jgi:hypothetical protein
VAESDVLGLPSVLEALEHGEVQLLLHHVVLLDLHGRAINLRVLLLLFIFHPFLHPPVGIVLLLPVNIIGSCFLGLEDLGLILSELGEPLDGLVDFLGQVDAYDDRMVNRVGVTGVLPGLGLVGLRLLGLMDRG